MRKGLVVAAAVAFTIAAMSCKAKYGCPGSPRKGELSNDQKIANGQKVKQTKYRGGQKSF